jgi:anti-sigma regulatory factor (Ser/Thr protein kinase)
LSRALLGDGAGEECRVVVSTPEQDWSSDAFSHEAVLYRGAEGLVGSVAPFIREGVLLGEPVLVAVLADRIEDLRDELGDEAEQVSFLDMEAIGRNPARIIPAWHQFVDTFSGHARVRGVGEPIWLGRREPEIAECQLHESLLNVAFDGGPGWRLLCPYDAESLPESVVREAIRTHPVVWNELAGIDVVYEGHAYAESAFAAPLSPPPDFADEIGFGTGDLNGLRAIVERLAVRAGVDRDTAADVTLAVHELSTNSLFHGGGVGSMCIWQEPDAFVVEVRDSGRITDPMVGRRLSSGTEEHGRGLWIANQLCDLVRVRSDAAGTMVRVYAWR